MTFTEIFSFMFIASLLVMSPGPNGLLVAKTVSMSGKKAGFANIIGFVLAFYMHGFLSIIGISALLLQSAELFFYVKIAGAAYLCWIGVKALISAWQGNGIAPSLPIKAKRRNFGKSIIEGFVTNALNPKVSMFYLAAFPQFIPQQEGGMVWAFVLVTLHIVINTSWFSAMVLMAARLKKTSQSLVFSRVLKTITGAIFIGFGMRLLTMRP